VLARDIRSRRCDGLPMSAPELERPEVCVLDLQAKQIWQE
jgi:hypothetical protein